MSVDKNTYGIIGYDLTGMMQTLLTDDFIESDKYEQYGDSKGIGYTQIFDDPMDRQYLYFGYIFFNSASDYSEKMESISIDKINEIIPEVKQKLNECFGISMDAEPEIMVFHEYC